MIPQPKYDVGDRVFYARVTYGQTDELCPDCLGKCEWQVRAPNGEEWQVPCNTCSRGYWSAGKVPLWGDFLHINECTIGSVQIDSADQERPVRYMCVETGVGTGTVYDEKNLFKTHPEAKVWGEAELARVRGLRQAEQEKMNKRKRGDTVFKREKKEKKNAKG